MVRQVRHLEVARFPDRLAFLLYAGHENTLPEGEAGPKTCLMQITLVMTVIGRDRPGLVDSLAGLVAQHGGNWLDSRMSRLGGQFAGILRVQIPVEREAPLVRSLK